ncbi:MAG TPA: hypothetical protein DCF63_13425 [Planctomycetaceae bacterium]|nr:hypothetical protein [Planctomycetaceae bacterium]
MTSAEIIAIGSELLTPSRIDTNSLWLTERLNEIGIEVCQKTIVGDEPLRLQAAIEQGLTRSQLVITTGGLGPTEDDMTRQCAAYALNRELVFREDLLEAISQRFRSMGYDMPAKNRVQAYLIDQAEVLSNDHGTAPGQWVRLQDRQLIILPGPPKELQPMFNAHVLPRLAQMAGQMSVRRKILRVSGMGESFMDELIAPIYTRYQNPQTATLFNKTEVEVQ